MTGTKRGDDTAERQRIEDDIANYGCHLVSTRDDGYLPAFVYTIGLCELFGHPELICFGLKRSDGRNIQPRNGINSNRGQLTAGKQYTGFLQGYPIQFWRQQKNTTPYYEGYGG